MTVRVGLTGSIGMGKSTTAKLFSDEGCAVWDADAAVHRLYSQGGAAVDPMRDAFPNAVIDGRVDRSVLKQIIAEDSTALPRIEAIVHPLVARDRQAFLDSAQSDIVVFDIPLLFEGSGAAMMDAVVVVSAPADIQRARVMDRGTMTVDQFEHILSKQMPDAEKRARADFVVETTTIDAARTQVRAILDQIRKQKPDA